MVCTLVKAGFDPEYILNRCTFRVVSTYIATVYKQQFEEGQRFGLVMSLAIGSLFSKDGNKQAQVHIKQVEVALKKAQRMAYGEDEVKVIERQRKQVEIDREEHATMTPHERRKKALRVALMTDLVFRKFTKGMPTMPQLRVVNNPGIVNVPIKDYEAGLDARVDRLMAMNDQLYADYMRLGKSRQIQKSLKNKKANSDVGGW